jgi:Fe2+ or Zn2+ uptake regulation protein
MAARYEASLSKHHHLLCDVCHDITNVNVPSLGPVEREIAAQYRYYDTDASLTVTGRCASCAALSVTNPGSAPEHEFEATSARRE